MATLSQNYLFNWREIDAASDLDRLRLVLSALSIVDEELMVTLEARRGGILDMFHRLVDELKKHLPDLGAKTAVDSKAIPYGRRPTIAGLQWSGSTADSTKSSASSITPSWGKQRWRCELPSLWS